MIEARPVWSDSLGAKSLCTYVKTPDIRLLIDPGAAVMQPSFPASDKDKLGWLREAKEAISCAASKADSIVISHYHFDHFTDFEAGLYEGKRLFLKDPNSYINNSQRARCESFLERACASFSGSSLAEHLMEPIDQCFPDPCSDIPIALSRSFGGYDPRREELLAKGRDWFRSLADSWRKKPSIPDLSLDNTDLFFSDDRSYVFADTTLRFTKPMFHGVEYSRLGWVIAVVVEHGRDRFIYSSDICGPIIEDYAAWIIAEDPSFLVLDGPPTYLVPYLMNTVNLERAKSNLLQIVENTRAKIILDHHLLREKRYRKRVPEVYMRAAGRGGVFSVAEFLGLDPAL